MDANGGGGGGGGSGGGSTFVGTLRPGTPGPGGHPTMHYFNPSFKNSSTTTPPRKSPFLVSERKGSGGNGHSSNRVPLDADSNGSSTVTCHKCGEQFSKWEAAETHHLSKHAGNFIFGFHFCFSLNFFKDATFPFIVKSLLCFSSIVFLSSWYFLSSTFL